MSTPGDGPADFGALVRDAGTRWPDAEAVVFPAGSPGPTRLTWSALAARAASHAALLAANGVGRGDHVALLLHNSPDFLAWLAAIATVGATAVPLNARYHPAELGYALAQSEATALVTRPARGAEPDLLARAREALALKSSPALALTFVLPPDDGTVVVERTAPRSSPPAGRAEHALLVYTSGTTAEPKGCLIRHSTWLAAARAMALDRYRLAAGDRLWDPLPMFHMAALHPFAACATVGATYVSMPHFEPATALAQLVDERIDVLYAAFPTILADLVAVPGFDAARLARVRRINCVAPPETLRRLQAEFPDAVLTSVYGLTEAGGVVAYGTPDEPLDVRVSTCGRPFAGLSVRIVGEDGATLPAGAVGGIELHGWCVFDGYWRRPDATDAALAPGGWLRTGDLGALDADGRLRFHGRAKDVLKVGGENVSALEVESHLARHPAVKLAQVIGRPDARLGEVPVAFVETRPGREVAAAALVEHCRAGLASFKVPREVRFVTEWPMSSTKIQKYRLREQLGDAAG